MDRLYIIGNGFDCYCHGMKTKYKDFRGYLIDLYPDCEDVCDVPYTKLTADHHGYDYADEDIASYIINILDACQGDDWSDLETALGSDIFDMFEDEFECIDFDDEDSEIYNTLEQNEDKGIRIAETFDKIKKLFFDWVTECLGDIDYNKINSKQSYSIILRSKIEDSFYINFNYTYTLEKVYGINPDKVWHIHGKVGDTYKQILFGHGNDGLTFDGERSWGATDHFDELAEELRKDTKNVIDHNRNLFKQFKDIKEIYSSGFSFSEVDMIYIHEICKYINPKNVQWYFNEYDANNNPQYIDKIKKLGFKIEYEKDW